MAESSLTDYVVRALRRKAHVVKHNDIQPGISDLSICELGKPVTRWVECKASASWPARPGTRVWWPHYTELQALFLRRRQGFLFVRVGKTYMLFRGEEAWALWAAEGWTRARMLQEAARVWHGGVVWAEFLEELRP